MERQELLNLIEPYVFGTATEDERRLVDQKLASGDKEFIARYREVAELSAQLADTVEQHDPPDRVRDQLMAKIAQSPSVAARPNRKPSIATVTGWVVLAAASIVLVVWTMQVQNREKEMHARVSAYEQKISQLQDDLKAYEDATFLLGQPGMQFVDLAGVAPNQQSFGKVVMDPDKGTAVIYMYELPQTPEGMEYQLWIMHEGQPTSAGTFTVAEDGSAVLKIHSMPDAAQVAAFEVTIEPEGGKPEPTGMMYLTSPDTYRERR